MRLPLLALAAGLIAASASSASALPVANAKTAPATAVEKVADRAVGVGDRDRRRMLHKRHYGKGHFFRRHRDIDWDDGRYSRYRGWHHYSYRPRGWRDRGCIAVGPIWFCP